MPTIVAKVDVSKIDKTKLFKGAKGTYLDLVLIETQNDTYGNSHMIVQGVSKAERDAGIKGAILGNAKTLGGGNRPAPRREETETKTIYNDDAPPPF